MDRCSNLCYAFLDALVFETVKGRDNRRDKEWKMIMFDIAEWVANVLVLGLGLFFWALAFGVSFLIISELKERYINE